MLHQVCSTALPPKRFFHLEKLNCFSKEFLDLKSMFLINHTLLFYNILINELLKKDITMKERMVQIKQDFFLTLERASFTKRILI